MTEEQQQPLPETVQRDEQQQGDGSPIRAPQDPSIQTTFDEKASPDEEHPTQQQESEEPETQSPKPTAQDAAAALPPLPPALPDDNTNIFQAAFPDSCMAEAASEMNNLTSIQNETITHPLEEDVEEGKASSEISDASDTSTFWSSGEEDEKKDDKKDDKKDETKTTLQDVIPPPQAPKWQPFEIEESTPQTSQQPVTRSNHHLNNTALYARLDLEYERALQDREILWNARYASVRQSAIASILFFAVFLLTGTLFYDKHTDWKINESLLFSIYTITTVGYGNHSMPYTAPFQVFTIFYIFVGIAALTILVAQAYQCLALEAARAQYARDKAEITRRGVDLIDGGGGDGKRHHGVSENYLMDFNNELQQREKPWEKFFYGIMNLVTRCKVFLKTTKLGNFLSVFLPLAGLLLLGAIVVGPLEGWTFLEAFYWAVVSLTTVGFGHYHPKQDASIWFCVFWLPFSVGFMSLFLGNVARFYIAMSNENIQRLENKMRRMLEQQRQEEDSSRQNSPNAKRKMEGFECLPTGEREESGVVLFGARESIPNTNPDGARRRDHILQNSSSNSSLFREDEHEVKTMMDILKSVNNEIKRHCKRNCSRSLILDHNVFGEVEQIPEEADGNKNVKASSGVRLTKPSLELRVLVLERFAEIIATDIAGYQSRIEIKENMLSVTIDTLKTTAEKWMIPRRARKAFRSVAFEALFFVGEHGLITRGAEALFDLSPMEFHGLFNPLLASMGDRGTMESWLASTNILADVELKKINLEEDATTERESELSQQPSMKQQTGGWLASSIRSITQTDVKDKNVKGKPKREIPQSMGVSRRVLGDSIQVHRNSLTRNSLTVKKGEMELKQQS